MFESDDFDQVLSQFELPNDISKTSNQTCETNNQGEVKENHNIPQANEEELRINVKKSLSSTRPLSGNSDKDTFVSPKHVKRKIINNHFDHNSKRKFPGPAGLLSGTLQESKDDTVCHMELLSQDIEFSQNNLHRDVFESPLWLRLLQDAKLWNLCNIDSISCIKQQAVAGNLCRRKAQIVTAFVETVDRSVTDPLMILRDSTGQIKSTLHRDAWTAFSPYLVSDCCAVILWKPTVLTTGSAFKKHYLNITLSNIYAVYSSAVLKEEDRNIPDNYVIKYEGDFTVIKTEQSTQDLSSSLSEINSDQNGANILLPDDLDSIFTDIF